MQVRHGVEPGPGRYTYGRGKRKDFFPRSTSRKLGLEE
jgi:hypothetical protein